jgi:hypothetical protein
MHNYTKEFKPAAVRRSRICGRRFKAVTSVLGSHLFTLSKWRTHVRHGWSVGKPADLIPNLLNRQFTTTRPNVA